MKKNLIVTLAVASMLMVNMGISAYADDEVQDTNSSTEVTTETTVDTDSSDEVITDTDATEDTTEDTDEEVAEDVTSDEDEAEDEPEDDEVTEDKDTTEDETDEDNDDSTDKKADKNDKNNKNEEKKEAIKQFREKKLSVKEKKIETKEFIKEIRKLFKDVDKEDRQELLDEIAQIKQELKDYTIDTFVKGVNVDYEKYDNVKPVIENNRTLAPIRAVTEALNAEVTWNEETEAITIKSGDVVVEMTIGSTTAYVNGTEVELDAAPEIRKGRTLVPARFIAESFNLNVEWDSASNSIIID